MNRAVVLAGLSSTLLAYGASASAPDVEKAFGNTIVSTYPDGRQGQLWLQPGGAYAAQGRRHDPSSGHWSVKGDKLCLKQTKPIFAPFSFCTQVPSGGVGSTWSAKAVTGEDIKVKLVKGRSSD